MNVYLSEFRHVMCRNGGIYSPQALKPILCTLLTRWLGGGWEPKSSTVLEASLSRSAMVVCVGVFCGLRKGVSKCASQQIACTVLQNLHGERGEPLYLPTRVEDCSCFYLLCDGQEIAEYSHVRGSSRRCEGKKPQDYPQSSGDGTELAIRC